MERNELTPISVSLTIGSLAFLAGCSTPIREPEHARPSRPRQPARHRVPSRRAGPSGKKVQYSAYPAKTFPDRVYFGDTHLRTSYSADAGMIGIRVGPEEAYRFARGEELTSSTGLRVKLGTHRSTGGPRGESWTRTCNRRVEPRVAKNDWGRMIYGYVKEDTNEGFTKAYDAWLQRMNSLDDPLNDQKGPASTMWAKATAAADRFNEPGRFTA